MKLMAMVLVFVLAVAGGCTLPQTEAQKELATRNSNLWQTAQQ
jgi:hypothetical protein